MEIRTYSSKICTSNQLTVKSLSVILIGRFFKTHWNTSSCHFGFVRAWQSVLFRCQFVYELLFVIKVKTLVYAMLSARIIVCLIVTRRLLNTNTIYLPYLAFVRLTNNHHSGVRFQKAVAGDLKYTVDEWFDHHLSFVRTDCLIIITPERCTS